MDFELKLPKLPPPRVPYWAAVQTFFELHHDAPATSPVFYDLDNEQD